MNSKQEIELLARCQEGNRQALDALMRAYQKPVYNAAYRMLGNREDAADATQTSFLKAFENLDKFDRNLKFFSWIYRIVLNESIDQIKRRKRFQPMTDVAGPDSELPPAQTARAEISDHVQAALMEIGEDARMVLVLRYFTECSYREIGEVLDIPGKTVKSRLFSARKQLRARMEQHGEGDR